MAVTPAQRRQALLRAFRARLKQAMGAKDWSQRDLATHLGIAESTVHNWLHKGGQPLADVMIELPYILGVSADWLFAGRGDQAPAEMPSGPAAEYLQGGRQALNEVATEFGQLLDEMGLRWKDDDVTDEARRRAAASLAHERRQADDARATPGRRHQSRSKGA